MKFFKKVPLSELQAGNIIVYKVNRSLTKEARISHRLIRVNVHNQTNFTYYTVKADNSNYIKSIMPKKVVGVYKKTFLSKFSKIIFRNVCSEKYLKEAE